MLTTIGHGFVTMTEQAGRFTTYLMDVLRACVRFPLEMRELSKQLESTGVASTPVVAVTTLFTGMVFTLQIYEGFARFGAEAYVPSVLSLALLRELAPVLGGLMVAGRVGSAIAAELGSMRVSDQIDALEVMGVDPVRYLVVPRFLAVTLMLPLLITIGDIIGILGGWWLLANVLDAPTAGFFDLAFQYMGPEDYWSGVIKAGFFGAIIAAVSCYQGLTTRGGAEGVGRATTQAVVFSSLAILVSDFFLTKVLF